jgi:hypothetical protein
MKQVIIRNLQLVLTIEDDTTYEEIIDLLNFVQEKIYEYHDNAVLITDYVDQNSLDYLDRQDESEDDSYVEFEEIINDDSN